MSTTQRMSPLRRWALAGAAVVVALAAVAVGLSRDGGPPVLHLAAQGGAASTLSETDDLAARSTMLPAYAHTFVLEDGARFGRGEASAWRLEAPADLEVAVRDLARRLGVDGEVTPAPFADGSFQVGAGEGASRSLWVGPAGDWSFHDSTGAGEWRCIEPDGGTGRPVAGGGTSGSSGSGASGSSGSGASGSAEPDVAEGAEAPPDGATAPGETRDPDAPVSDVPADGDAVEPVPPGTDPGDGDVVVEPCEPVPPEGLPDEAEARSAAEGFLASLDLPLRPRVVAVHVDPWYASAEAGADVAGVPTDLYVGIGFGTDAAVTSANATLARPVELATYPTIDAEAAIARLEDQQATWTARPMPELDLGAPDDTVTSDAADGPVTSDGADAPAPSDATDDPAPPPGAEPGIIDETEPEPRTVTLVAAEPMLLLWFDVDGAALLLPGVRFTDTDGGTWPVVTVADEYLDTGDDVPSPPVDGGTRPAPEPAPMPMPADDPDPSVTPLPGDDVAAEVAARVVGLAEQDAVEVIEAAGLVARVVSRDGEGLAGTHDLRVDRINLAVEGGHVIEAHVG